ncbi:unnamed protein product [Paramecium octaurelia]|uniref:Uncharacterized protein n=1 Tax=Paramecium octaurelia TaxID=43137 RepID=A0A8S1TPD6_PAROT|nr:unnamed protein product [Paramecium octaurelia]
MSQFQVNLINLSNPHDQTIYSYNTSTLIVDLHQQLAQKSDHGNVQIYFTQNQPFKGNLNRYLHQNIKESSIYYNLNVSQIQTPSVQSLMNTQENKKQLIISGLQNQNSSQSILGSSYQSKSEKLCQTDDESFLQSNGNQQINQEQIYQLQSKVQDLNAILKQKEEEMQKTMYENEILSKDLQNQNEKNNQIILDLNRQNDDLKDQLTQLSRKAQLDEKNIENLKTQIEQLKIENESKNIITHQIMQLNDNHFQKQQGLAEIQQEQNQLQSQKNEIDLLSFNDTVETYKNKCGHMIERNKLENLLIYAVKNKQIVKCETCNSNFSSSICQDIGMIGQNYLKLKSTLELSEMQNSFKALQKSHLNVVTCENRSCNFFCVYQTANQYSDSDYSYCPNCLGMFVKNPQEVPQIINL